jgi:hypothetical protein
VTIILLEPEFPLPRYEHVAFSLADRVTVLHNDRVVADGSREEVKVSPLVREISNPDLLLMDEPAEGLAPILVQEVGRVIGALKAGRLSILLAEQNLPMALGVADHTHVLSRGGSSPRDYLPISGRTRRSRPSASDCSQPYDIAPSRVSSLGPGPRAAV